MNRKSRKLNANQKKAHDFLKTRASDQRPFTVEDFADATGWKNTTPQTYLNKQFIDYLRKTNGQYVVRSTFLTLNDEQFFELVTQRRSALTEYRRTIYEHLVMYEFLLPLTKENVLRDGLDALFYRDSIERRLKEIGLDKVSMYIDKDEIEPDEAYLERVIDFVSERFGGYSISHVQGRFRADSIMSIAQAAENLTANKKYLIDETTAVVRFIIPCKFSREEFDNDFSQVYAQSGVLYGETPLEVKAIRFLFFALFVEAVVEVVKNEDAIWLLERAGLDRLYVWEKE